MESRQIKRNRKASKSRLTKDIKSNASLVSALKLEHSRDMKLTKQEYDEYQTMVNLNYT